MIQSIVVIQILEAAQTAEEKAKILTRIFQSREYEPKEMEAFLAKVKETEPQTVLGRLCAQFLDVMRKGQGKSETFDEHGILFQIRTRSVSDHQKLVLLNQNLRFLHRSAPIMQWLEQQSKHGSGVIKSGTERILSMVQQEIKMFRPALSYDDAEGVTDPISIHDFFKMTRTQKLWWLMARREDSLREEFIFQNAQDLMQKETDSFVVSNLVKRIPEAIALRDELHLDLVKMLHVYEEHEDNRVRANLLEGYDVLMQKARYRIILYPQIVKATTEAKDNRIRSTALRIRYKYAPRETKAMVEAWISETNTLGTLASLRWLIESVPEVQQEFGTALKSLESELGTAAKKIIAAKGVLTGDTLLR